MTDESSQLLSSITETEDADKTEDNMENSNDSSREASGSGVGVDENIETYSESNSTAISHNLNREAGPGGRSQAVSVRAEPLSAKQQVALWLTRTSTQELYNELRMANIRSWVTGEAGEAARGRHKQPLCGPRGAGEQIHRNYSTKSLLETGAACTFHEEQRLERNPMRKCETVIALTEEPQQKKSGFRQKSKSKVSLCASRISFFKRSASKCHSEIMPSSNIPHQFPGIRPTNRLRYNFYSSLPAQFIHIHLSKSRVYS